MPEYLQSFNFARTSTTVKLVSSGHALSKKERLSHGKSAVYYLKVCTNSNCPENNRFCIHGGTLHTFRFPSLSFGPEPWNDKPLT